MKLNNLTYLKNLTIKAQQFVAIVFLKFYKKGGVVPPSP